MTGSLPRAASIRKFFLMIAAVVVYFLPGHLAVMALLAYVLVTAMASTTNSAKTRSLESRVAAHVTATAPAVNFVANGGTVGGSVTINGGHTVTGSQTVQGDHTIDGTLHGGGGTLTTDAAFTMSGNAAVLGTFYGSGGSGGPLHVDAATTVDTLNISAGAFFIAGNGITRQSSPGTISGTGTNSQLTNAVNAIIGQLRSTGWFT